MNIRFLWIGKTKNAALKSLVEDYSNRIRRMGPCEIVEVRDLSKRQSLRPSDLIEAEGKELARYVPEHSCLVALEETGSPFTSREFAGWLESRQNAGTRGITFVIGGAEGLSRVISARSNIILSLGKMTWTHEMCRVLLLEQVYRALCIMRNMPYHRGGNGLPA